MVCLLSTAGTPNNSVLPRADEAPTGNSLRDFRLGRAPAFPSVVERQCERCRIEHGVFGRARVGDRPGVRDDQRGE